MDKTKFMILVAFVLALLYFCSLDVEANASNRSKILFTGIENKFSKSYIFNLYSDHIFSNGSNFYCVVGETNHYKFDTGVLKSVNVKSIAGYTLCDFFSLELWPNITCEVSQPDIVDHMFYNYKLVYSPYVVVNGVKYYIRNGYSYHEVGLPWSNEYFYIGVEVDLFFDIWGSNLSSSPDSFVGSFTLLVNSGDLQYQVRGNNYVSTGENQISSKIDELKQALTSDYDSSVAESVNTELSGSLDSINTAEGTAMTDAKVDVGNYDTASVFNFAPAVISSLSLITTFANSFFRASGDLTTALTVLFALVFISAVVGFLRFVK